jgi:undecaprenyl phosphate-alpha-L-ara4N flippase subunit ArnE
VILQSWLLLGAVVVLGTGGQLALKSALSRSHSMGELARSPLIWAWVSSYALSTLFWLAVLRSVPLSVAFPVLGLQYALVPLASAVILGETMNWRQRAGVMLVFSGVVLVGGS